MKKSLFALLAVASAVAFVPNAWGSTIPIVAVGTYTLGSELDSITGVLVSNGGVSPTYTADYTETVYSYGSGLLAFEYTVTDAGTDSIGSMSTNYGGAADSSLSMEVSSGNVFGAYTAGVGTVTMTFLGNLDAGDSASFIVFTDATDYGSGGISFLDSYPTTGTSLVPTPEPSGLFLLGTGLLGLGLLVRQRLTN